MFTPSFERIVRLLLLLLFQVLSFLIELVKPLKLALLGGEAEHYQRAVEVFDNNLIILRGRNQSILQVE